MAARTPPQQKHMHDYLHDGPFDRHHDSPGARANGPAGDRLDPGDVRLTEPADA
jgi:hypothetical protein